MFLVLRLLLECRAWPWRRLLQLDAWTDAIRPHVADQHCMYGPSCARACVTFPAA